MSIITFYALLRDAFIYKLNQSEAGREYLEKCWRIMQTKPDRAGIREQLQLTGTAKRKG